MGLFDKLFGKRGEPRAANSVHSTGASDNAAAERFLSSITVTDDVPANEYTMWCPTPERPQLVGSPTHELLTSIYNESHGYETFILARLFSRLGVVQPDARRVPYPRDGLELAITHSSGEPFILTANQEKGLRLHFSAATPPARRESILDEYLAFVRGVKEEFVAIGADADPESDPNALAWWNATTAASRNLESEGRNLKGLGTIDTRQA